MISIKLARASPLPAKPDRIVLSFTLGALPLNNPASPCVIHPNNVLLRAVTHAGTDLGFLMIGGPPELHIIIHRLSGITKRRVN